MKKISLLLSLSVILFSCSHNNEPKANGSISVDVGLHTTTTLIDSLCAPMRAAQDATLANKIKHLVYILLDSDGNVAASATQEYTDTDFGTLSLNAPVGDYTLCVCGNNSTAPTINSDGTLTFTKCGDTFSHAQSVTITSAQRATASVILTRAIAKLRFISSEDCAASKVNVTVGGISSIFDISAHQGSNTTNYSTGIVSCPLSQTNKLDGSVLVLIPGSEVSNATLTLTYYDASNQQVGIRSFSGIPLKQGCVTTAEGALFHDHGVNGGISLNESWGQTIDVEL